MLNLTKIGNYGKRYNISLKDICGCLNKGAPWKRRLSDSTLDLLDREVHSTGSPGYLCRHWSLRSTVLDVFPREINDFIIATLCFWKQSCLIKKCYHWRHSSQDSMDWRQRALDWGSDSTYFVSHFCHLPPMTCDELLNLSEPYFS